MEQRFLKIGSKPATAYWIMPKDEHSTNNRILIDIYAVLYKDCRHRVLDCLRCSCQI